LLIPTKITHSKKRKFLEYNYCFFFIENERKYAREKVKD